MNCKLGIPNQCHINKYSCAWLSSTVRICLNSCCKDFLQNTLRTQNRILRESLFQDFLFGRICSLLYLNFAHMLVFQNNACCSTSRPTPSMCSLFHLENASLIRSINANNSITLHLKTLYFLSALCL